MRSISGDLSHELSEQQSTNNINICLNISGIAKTYGMALHPHTNEIYFIGGTKHSWPRYLYKMKGNMSEYDFSSPIEYTQIT